MPSLRTSCSRQVSGSGVRHQPCDSVEVVEKWQGKVIVLAPGRRWRRRTASGGAAGGRLEGAVGIVGAHAGRLGAAVAAAVRVALVRPRQAECADGFKRRVAALAIAGHDLAHLPGERRHLSTHSLHSRCAAEPHWAALRVALARSTQILSAVIAQMCDVRAEAEESYCIRPSGHRGGGHGRTGQGPSLTMSTLAQSATHSLPYVTRSPPHTGALVVGVSVQSHAASQAGQSWAHTQPRCIACRQNST